MRRNYYINIANETKKVLKTGSYEFNNTTINISSELEWSIGHSVLYRDDMNDESIINQQPCCDFPQDKTNTATRIEIRDCNTLDAAQDLASDPNIHHVGVLNFASARHPGGGWDTGAVAQEECLARASGLHPCLQQYYKHAYAIHEVNRTGFYSHTMIFCPKVPVFRDGEDNYLERPYLASFISSAAVNAGVVNRSTRGGNDVYRAMSERIYRILLILQSQGCDGIVLGAFGCGVFRNDPHQVADIFNNLLNSKFQNVFSRVVFAILGSGNSIPFSEVIGLPVQGTLAQEGEKVEEEEERITQKANRRGNRGDRGRKAISDMFNEDDSMAFTNSKRKGHRRK